MEKIKNNVIYAIKNIRFHIRDFICFFIAIFVIQSVFGIISFCYYNNNILDYEYARAEYSHHLTLENLCYDQYDYIVNDDKYSNRSGDALFEITGTVKHNIASSVGTRYDVYITFNKNPAKSVKTFEKRYYEGLENNSDGEYIIKHTPLLDYEQSVKSNRRVQILTVFAVFVCSLLLMMRLFTVRMNHYRFTYGVYMTFGANFKKLFSSSNYEMLLITLITYIPSAVLSFIASRLVYSLVGVDFRITVIPFIYMFVLSIAVSFLAVYLPMKRLSCTVPIKALAAENNSNLVVSPRASSDRIKRAFPHGYITTALLRFRRYISAVIFFGVAFSAVFVGGVFFSEIYKDAASYNYPRFTMDFSGGNDSFDESTRDKLAQINGVADIKKYQSTKATYANSHILFSRGDVKLFSGFLSRRIDGKKYLVTNSVEYSVLDSAIADELEKTSHSGNIADALNNENTIVISDSKYNEKCLKLSVGDKIKIGNYLYAKTVPDTYETGNDYLNQQLDCNEYSYREYTVGAVIHGMSGDNLKVFLPGVDYALLCCDSKEFNFVDVYTKPDITVQEAESVEKSLKDYAYAYDDVIVKENINSEQLHLKEKNIPAMLFIIALMILFISPTMWVFSQVLFYLKREDEIYLLGSLGATGREIRKIYLGEGIAAAAISALLYSVLSVIASLLVCKAGNRIFINPGFDFHVPIVPFIIGLAITVASALVSSVIPYMVYMKKKNNLASVLSEDSE